MKSACALYVFSLFVFSVFAFPADAAHAGAVKPHRKIHAHPRTVDDDYEDQVRHYAPGLKAQADAAEANADSTRIAEFASRANAGGASIARVASFFRDEVGDSTFWAGKIYRTDGVICEFEYDTEILDRDYEIEISGCADGTPVLSMGSCGEFFQWNGRSCEDESGNYEFEGHATY